MTLFHCYFFIWNPFFPFSLLSSYLWFMHKSYSNFCSFVSTFNLSGKRIHCLVLSVISVVTIKAIWTLTFEIHTDVYIKQFIKPLCFVFLRCTFLSITQLDKLQFMLLYLVIYSLSKLPLHPTTIRSFYASMTLDKRAFYTM